MEIRDDKLNIEEVQQLTSKLACVNSVTIDINEREKLEQDLNAMFGQWYEGD